MNDSTTPPNPFDPSDSQHATWPQPFEPGRDLAELAIIYTTPSIVMPSASVGEPLTIKHAQEMRRALVEDDYPRRMQTVLGDDLTRVFQHEGGATLYFKQVGRIADQGRKLIVVGGMDETLDAQRIVSLGRERGWKTISFTGSGSFVELAMREALNERLIVIASDAKQEVILAKIMAERAKGAGAVAMTEAATSDDNDIIKLLDELDDLPAQPVPGAPKPALPILPVAAPLASRASSLVRKTPYVDVLPRFLNLPARLQERREQELLSLPGMKGAPPSWPHGRCNQ